MSMKQNRQGRRRDGQRLGLHLDLVLVGLGLNGRPRRRAVVQHMADFPHIAVKLESMSMKQNIEIDGKQVSFKASAAIPRIYRMKFHRDIYKDLRSLEKSIGDVSANISLTMPIVSRSRSRMESPSCTHRSRNSGVNDFYECVVKIVLQP